MTELFTSGPYTCGEYDPTTAGFDKDSLNLTGEEINLFCGVRNFYGISSALISLLGLVGNTFCLILLPKTGGAKSAIILLFTLGLYDIVFLVSSMFLKAIPSLTLIGHSTVVVSNVLSPAIFPLFLTAHLGAIYTTAAISVERCLAITAPFRTRQWLTSRRIKVRNSMCLYQVDNTGDLVLEHQFQFTSVSRSTCISAHTAMVHTRQVQHRSSTAL
ncbi:FMRFamide receptor [Biomphalaria glabrata]